MAAVKELFEDFLEKAKDWDRATQIKRFIAATLAFTGFILFCIEAHKAHHSHKSNAFVTYYDKGGERNAFEKGDLLPAATICPSDRHHKIDEIKCKFFEHYSPGKKDPITVPLKAKLKEVEVDWVDGFPVTYDCYEVNKAQEHTAFNWTQAIACEIFYAAADLNEQTQARVALMDYRKYSTSKEEPTSTYGWKTLDGFKHTELYVEKKEYRGDGHEFWIQEVRHGEWWNRNRTAIMANPSMRAAVSFQYGFKTMWFQEYREIRYPYDSGASFLGVMGGLCFVLTLANAAIFFVLSTVLGVAPPPSATGTQYTPSNGDDFPPPEFGGGGGAAPATGTGSYGAIG